ncbi:MAG: hypothetical protein ACR2LK_06620 [Solirubrobacteraceae bacterium]
MGGADLRGAELRVEDRHVGVEARAGDANQAGRGVGAGHGFAGSDERGGIGTRERAVGILTV